MNELFNTLMEWLSTLNSPYLVYVVIFGVLVVTGIGIPISEELVVLGAGVLVAVKDYDLFPIFAACYLGVVVADSIVVYLGWHFGHAVLHRKWVKRVLHPRRLLWAKRQVHDHGVWVIAASRFIPGSRYPALLIGGMMHITRWKFILADATAAIVSVSLQLAVGWWIGHISKNLSQVDYGRYTREITLGCAALGVVMIAGYALYHRRQKARGGGVKKKRVRLRKRRTLSH